MANPQVKPVSQMDLDSKAKFFFLSAGWVNYQKPVLFVTYNYGLFYMCHLAL